MSTVTGSCHCGSTRFTVPPPTSVTSCNCTYCSKLGALWAYYQPSDLKVESNEHSALYSRNGVVKHYHCQKCGCGTYGESPEWEDGGDGRGFQPHPTNVKVAINARLLDDFDLEKVPVEFVDGKNLW